MNSGSVGAAGGFRVRHQDSSLATPLGGATCAASELHPPSIIARLSKPALPNTHRRCIQPLGPVVTRPRLALLFPLFPCAQVFASFPPELTTSCSLPPALVPPPSSAPMKEIIMQSLHLPVLLPARHSWHLREPFLPSHCSSPGPSHENPPRNSSVWPACKPDSPYSPALLLLLPWTAHLISCPRLLRLLFHSGVPRFAPIISVNKVSHVVFSKRTESAFGSSSRTHLSS